MKPIEYLHLQQLGRNSLMNVSSILRVVSSAGKSLGTIICCTNSISENLWTKYLGNGLDYHFITRNEFDESIAAGAFLEYGMNKSGALYGTLLAEVDKIIQDNRIPLLCPPPQSLEKIKNKKYKAHVVFLKVFFYYFKQCYLKLF